MRTARTVTAASLMVSLAVPAVAQSWDEGRLKTAYGAAVLFIEGTATLKAELPADRRPRWSGTGFIVHDKGWVITNHHVLRPRAVPGEQIATIELTARPGSNVAAMAYPLTVVKSDPDLDVALLRLPERAEGWRTITPIDDSNRVGTGTKVFVLGYPLGKNLDARGGTITDPNAAAARFQTDTPVNHGNSGGPVFNEHGRVVAVVFGGVDEAKDIAYFIPINYARGLLQLIGPGW